MQANMLTQKLQNPEIHKPTWLAGLPPLLETYYYLLLSQVLWVKQCLLCRAVLCSPPSLLYLVHAP